MKRSLVVFALRAVWRRKVRAVAVGGGLVFAVALLAAVVFLTESLRFEAERAHAVQPDIVVQKLVGGRPTTLRAGEAHSIETIASVGEVTPRTWGYVFLPALQGNVTIVGTSSRERALSVANGVLAEGRDLAPFEAHAHEMLVGTELARFLGLRPGDELGLPTANPEAHALRLVGTFRSSLDLFTADVIVCDTADASAILAMPEGEATDFAITLSNPNETRVVARSIVERLPGARVIEREQLARVHHLAYGRRAGFVLGAMIPAFLAFLILAWDRASGLGTSERSEIAILKAVGWSTVDVLWAKLFESLLVGSAATALGLTFGYAWVFWLGAPGLRPALVGWSVLYPHAKLTPAVDFAQLLGVALAVLGPFALTSIVPAWRAATTDPLDTMRS